MRDLLGRARDAGPENRLGGNENLLARLHVSAMPVVDLPKAFLLRQAETGDVLQIAPPVGPEISAVVTNGCGSLRSAFFAPFSMSASFGRMSSAPAVTQPSPYIPTASHALGPLAAT